ncbi:hypothetical protein Q5P01_013497 [Channa striata]|uniref:LIM zinc-binding domain-containing protein n=1 Tax=Channa striata TaxID=64152 RepID=A0AA88SHT1_CHASR|nr:hypothetical protein Q5P01_013497 [Channa striata]
MQSLQDASSERKKCQQDIDVQGDVRGTIQLLMESPSSPRMQRSPSLEGDLKGDVKMSIKSLYDKQEQTQLEKEEVIKGDVKGTIKSLLETAQRDAPKVRLGSYRRVRVKQSPPVKNLNADAQRNIQKIKTANVSKTSKENDSLVNETQTIRKQACAVAQSVKQSTAVVEHKTITQNHGIRTLKTEFRNLKSKSKGTTKQDKTKVKTDVYILKPEDAEQDLPLPPPPPPMGETDLPPPPTPPPPTADTDIDLLPPPPPPLASEQDFLPPPPSQQELESLPAQAIHPSPAKAKKMTVKKVKAPALHPVPKLEPKVDFNKTQQVEVKSDKVVEISHSQLKTTTHTSKTVTCVTPPLPGSPQPLKKVYIPLKFTPPPSPPPFMRGKMSKFTTPLIKAEEKYRKLKEEENTPPTTPTPNYTHDSVIAALEMLSNRDVEQSNNTASEIPQQKAEETALIVHSNSAPCDLSKHVVISNITQSSVSASHEKGFTESAIISTAKQQIVSNETSKVVSLQKTSSVSAVRQQMHTTTQKAVSSKQSAQSVMTDRVQTSINDVTKMENMTADSKKDSKNLKTKAISKPENKNKGDMCSDQIPVPIVKSEIAAIAEASIKAESKKIKDNTAAELFNNQSSKKENVTSDKNAKESKLPQHDNRKKNDQSPAKSQEKVSDESFQTEKTAAHSNGKTGKPNQKVKKNNKQEKQVEIKMSSEGEKQTVSQDVKVELQETTEVKVISEGKEVKTEPKPSIKKVPPHATTLAPAVTETIAVPQIQKSTKEEHIEVKKEATTTESKDNQDSQQQKAVQKHAKASQKKKGVTVIQQSTEEPPEESMSLPITGELEQNEELKITKAKTEESQRREVQVLISHITEMQTVSEKTGSKSYETLVSPQRIPELGGSAVESDVHKYEEILSHLRKLPEEKLTFLEATETMEKHKSESVSEKGASAAATPRISKISIGSARIENQRQKNTSQERRKDETGQCKSLDLRAPSPLLRMRSPSPTFITIESTRRTDSPHRVTPSPTLLHRPPTPPTPPPRRCDTPTSRLTRITPSPTFDRAENLARLKDTTAKLSRGVTPPPLLSPQTVSEKKSEIVESPASFHRKIKIDSQVVETLGTLLGTEKTEKSLSEEVRLAEHAGKDLADISEVVKANEKQSKAEIHSLVYQNDTDPIEASGISEPSSVSVKEKREFFEEAQKAEINKIYVRKEPIAIPERLGPDMEECEAGKKNKEKDELPRADLSSLVNKFESAEEKIYNRKELIPLAERIHNEAESTDCDKEKVDILEQEMPSFDIQAIKNVFELAEQSSSFRQEKGDQEEPMSSLSETTADTSKRKSPPETKGSSRQSTPLPIQKLEVESAPAEPSALCETNSITEHFSNVDQFGNKVRGTRTTITGHSECVSTQQAPFSYADAVKRKTATARQSETQRPSHLVRVPKSELCTVCRRRAYPMDAVIVDRKKYHKSCFYCEHCKNKLSLGNYVSLHGHFYCLHHYKQLLKSKGNCDNGFGQKHPTRSGVPISSHEKLEWRYSMSSMSSEDKIHSSEKSATKMRCVSPGALPSCFTRPPLSRLPVLWDAGAKQDRLIRTTSLSGMETQSEM